MSVETELKLLLPKASVTQLKTHPFWKKFANGEPETFHLGNSYYDTPDRALSKANVALRIREKKGQYFQTLKTRGESVNGLTRRGEWEWSIPDRQLDIEGLKKVWPSHLERVSLDQLRPLFSTDFDRTTWNITIEGSSVEAALDIGQIVSGQQQSAICELELELLEGDESVLIGIADQLRKDISLTPSDKSKAERGFELL